MKKSGYNESECMLIALNDLGIATDDWILSTIHSKLKGFHNSDFQDLADRYKLILFNSWSYNHDTINKYATIDALGYRYYISWKVPAIIINKTGETATGITSHAVCVPLHSIVVFNKPMQIFVQRKDIVTKRKI